MNELQNKQADISKTCDFHSELPALGLGICAEVGELVDYLTKMSNLEKPKVGDDLSDLRQAAKEECTDVLVYLLQIANKLDFNLEEAYLNKCKVLLERHQKTE